MMEDNTKCSSTHAPSLNPESDIARFQEAAAVLIHGDGSQIEVANRFLMSMQTKPIIVNVFDVIVSLPVEQRDTRTFLLAAQGLAAFLRIQSLPAEINGPELLKSIIRELLRYLHVKPLRNQLMLLTCLYAMRHLYSSQPKRPLPNSNFACDHRSKSEQLSEPQITCNNLEQNQLCQNFYQEQSHDRDSIGHLDTGELHEQHASTDDFIMSLSLIREQILAENPSAEWVWMCIMAMVPEEVDRKEFKVSSTVKQSLRQTLREHSKSFFDFVFQQINSDDEMPLLKACVNACDSWVTHRFVAFNDMYRIIERLVNWFSIAAADAVQADTASYLDEDVLFSRVGRFLITCTETYTTSDAVSLFGGLLIPISDGCQHYLTITKLLRSYVCNAGCSLYFALPEDQWHLLLQQLIVCTGSSNPQIADEMVFLWSSIPEIVKANPTLQDHLLPFLRRALEAVIFQGQYPTGALSADGEEWLRIKTLRESVRTCLRSLMYNMPVLGPWFVEAASTALQETCRNISDETWPCVEALIHGTSAVAKRFFEELGTDSQQGSLQRSFIETCCSLPDHPALLCTMSLLFGGIANLLPDPLLEQVCTKVFRTLHFSEYATTFPMRVNEDHVGAIALLKLSRTCPDPNFFEELWSAYQTPEVKQCLSSRSQFMLLEAICESLNHELVVQKNGLVIQNILLRFFQNTADAVSNARCSPEDLSKMFKELRVISHTIRKAPCVSYLHRVWLDQLNVQTDHKTLLKACIESTLLPPSDSHQQFHHSQPPTNGQFSNVSLPHRTQLQIPYITPAPLCIQELCETLEVAVANMALYTDQLGGSILTAASIWQEMVASPQDPKVLEMVTIRFEDVNAVLPVLSTALKRHQAYATDSECLQAFYDLIACCCTICPSAVIESDALPVILTEYVHHPIAACHAGTQQQFADKALVGSLCRMISSIATSHLHDGQLLLSRVFYNTESDAQQQEQFLVNTLLLAVCGGLPSWALDDIMVAICGIIEELGVDTFCQLLYGAMCLPNFARPDVSDKAKQIFLEDTQRLSLAKDWKRLKNAVKKFCHGKKKNTSGTPTVSSRVRTKSAPTA